MVFRLMAFYACPEGAIHTGLWGIVHLIESICWKLQKIIPSHYSVHIQKKYTRYSTVLCKRTYPICRHIKRRKPHDVYFHRPRETYRGSTRRRLNLFLASGSRPLSEKRFHRRLRRSSTLYVKFTLYFKIQNNFKQKVWIFLIRKSWE